MVIVIMKAKWQRPGKIEEIYGNKTIIDHLPTARDLWLFYCPAHGVRENLK